MSAKKNPRITMWRLEATKKKTVPKIMVDIPATYQTPDINTFSGLSEPGARAKDSSAVVIFLDQLSAIVARRSRYPFPKK